MNIDRRLVIEFMPGAVFLIANAIWGLFPATGAAIAATVLAIIMRYRIDAQLPYLGIAAVCLSTILMGASIVLADEQFIKLKPTISGVAFAMILLTSTLARPTLLERSLGYKIILIPSGWRVLHLSWSGLALIFAVFNELVWRNTHTDTWVIYSTVIGPLALAVYWGATWVVAWYYWDEDEDEDEDDDEEE